MSAPHKAPQKRLTRLFEWFCNAEYFEELQGDLEERFYRNASSLGNKKANRIYRSEILKMLRPSVIGKVKLKYQFNNISMLKNYMIIAFRSISRNRLFSSINIFGLSISLCVCLLAFSLIGELMNFDSFHKYKNQVYRVNTQIKYTQRPIRTEASTTLALLPSLTENFHEIEEVAAFRYTLNDEVILENKSIRISGLYGNESVLSTFTFPLVSGNPETALGKPNSIVLTEDLAVKLFGHAGVVGQIITLESGGEYQITGVLKNLPKNSHIKFDVLASLATIESHERAQGIRVLNNWNDRWENYLYVKVKPGADLSRLKTELSEIGRSMYAESEQLQYINFVLEPLDDIALGGVDNNPIGFVFPRPTIKFILGLALIVLVSAGFNYINLSLATISKRTREIGVRKTFGAKQVQVMSQFTLESIVLSWLSLAMAYLLFYLVKDSFIGLIPTRGLIGLDVTPTLVLFSFLFASFVGLTAGIFPSYIISKLKVLSILGKHQSVKLFKNLHIRKVLLGLQITLSIIFINGAFISNAQYQYIQNHDLGYNIEDVYNINLQGKDFQTFFNEYSSLPEVMDISQSSFVTNSGRASAQYAYYDDKSDSTNVFTLHIDDKYLPLHQYDFIAGHNFSRNEAPFDKVVVNEEFLDRFGFDNPNSALGETIHYHGSDYAIIGVVRDFNYERLNYKIRPFAFQYIDQPSGYANLKINTTTLAGFETVLEKKWQSTFQNDDFDGMLYESLIERSNGRLVRMGHIIQLISLLAISIATLGLLGMVVYDSSSRLKEISIRKVLGADRKNLLSFLSQNYISLFVIATMLSAPISYWYFNKSILNNYEYRINIGMPELVSGTTFLLLISGLIIGLQVQSVHKKNPVNTLRNE